MLFYLDTSALLKRYVQEVGSGWLAMLAVPTTGNTFRFCCKLNNHP